MHGVKHVSCCFRYHRHRVYAGLADGTVAVFDPRHPAAGHTHLINVSSAPIVSCISLGGQLLVASQSSLYVINATHMEAKVSSYTLFTQENVTAYTVP